VKIAQMGRIYMDYRWEVKLGYESRYNYTPSFPEDYVRTETPRLVSNGKWVMERPHNWAWLVGMKHNEVEDLQYIDKDGVRHVLYVSDKPFGYVTTREGEYVPGRCTPFRSAAGTSSAHGRSTRVSSARPCRSAGSRTCAETTRSRATAGSACRT